MWDPKILGQCEVTYETSDEDGLVSGKALEVCRKWAGTTSEKTCISIFGKCTHFFTLGKAPTEEDLQHLRDELAKVPNIKSVRVYGDKFCETVSKEWLLTEINERRYMDPILILKCIVEQLPEDASFSIWNEVDGPHVEINE